MQKIIYLLFLTVLATQTNAQTNYEKFKTLYKGNDSSKIKMHLAAWEQANPDDPELYTAAFNFYFSNSRQEVISLNKEQHSKESFELTDSTGTVAGYINSNLRYNPAALSRAFSYINKGIEKFPSRLDIRFGKCYVLGQIGDYGNFTKEIIQTIEYSVTIKNNWLWTESKKLDDAENFMLGSIQEYLKQLYDTEDDHLLENMLRIGDITLKYYPNNVEILSTTAVANLLTKNYDKAIAYLKQAEQLNPKDFIVLNNIAQGYKLKGDKENAIKYYQLTEKYGDEQAKKLARENIEELKK
jgi:tetratricopeptide (TPR) repeat protein